MINRQAPSPSSSYSSGIESRRHTVNELKQLLLTPLENGIKPNSSISNPYDLSIVETETTPPSPSSASPLAFPRADKRRASLALRRQSNANVSLKKYTTKDQ